MKSSKPNNIVALKTENQVKSGSDWLKWTLSVILLLAGLIGNHYYSEVSMLVRTGVWFAILALAAFVASTTNTGRWVVAFFRDSRMELRKVVWPSRKDTQWITLIIGVVVCILAIILWGMDSTLVWLIGWLTGQRG